MTWIDVIIAAALRQSWHVTEHRGITNRSESILLLRNSFMLFPSKSFAGLVAQHSRCVDHHCKHCSCLGVHQQPMGISALLCFNVQAGGALQSKMTGKVVIAIVILVLSTVGHPTGLNCTFRLGYLPLLSTLDMRRATAEKAAGVLVA